jgi:hypothetical protein
MGNTRTSRSAWGEVMSDQIAEAVRRHAELILKAKGTSLRNYMPNSQRDILAAVMDCYEEAYRAGADFASEHGSSSERKAG